MREPGKQRIVTPLRVVSFLAGVVVLVLLLRQVDFGELGRLLFQARMEWVLLGGAAYLVKSSLRARRTASLLQGARPRFLPMLRLSLASSLAGQILPFKLGEIVYVYLLRREMKSPITEGVSSLMLIRIFDLLGIALLFIGAAVVFGLPPGFSNYLTYIIAFVALLLAFLAAAAAVLRALPFLTSRAPELGRRLRWTERRDRAAGWLERKSPRARELAGRMFTRMEGSARRLAGSLRAYRGRQIAGWFALALLEWLANLVVYHCLLHAIGLAPHPFDTAAAVTFAALASVLPVNSLGSFGTQEAGWTAGLMLLGYDASTAITSGFATHLLQLGYNLLLGGLAWISYMARR